MPPNRRALSEQVLANLGQGDLTVVLLEDRLAVQIAGRALADAVLAQRAPRAVGLPDFAVRGAVTSRRACTKRQDLTDVGMEEVDAAEWGSCLGRGAPDTGLGALQAAARGEDHREPALEDGIRPAIQSRPGKAAGRRSASVLVLLAPPPRGPVAGADPVRRDAAPPPLTGPRTGSVTRHSAVPPPRLK